MSGIEKKPVLIMGESSSIGEATPLEQMSLLFGGLPCGGPIRGLMNEKNLDRS